MSLLSVENLEVLFNTDDGVITAVDKIGFALEEGEVLGLVGESGSGKSVTAKSLMQLNPLNTFYGKNSSIRLKLGVGELDVLRLKSSKELVVVRGGAISMMFQEPMASFAPAITIGSQMVEQLMIHSSLSRSAAQELSIEMLQRVGISEADKRFHQYAFELSGGMRQRAMIAMALSTKPKILIADEPTTALDVTIQAQVLDLMKDLIQEFGMAILFITHDLGVIAQVADRVAVMYLGRIVESGPVKQVLHSPAHPYTRSLLNSLPKLDALDEPLTPIPGDIPSPLERPPGCGSHTRCPEAIEGKCSSEIPISVNVEPGHQSACFLNESPVEKTA